MPVEATEEGDSAPLAGWADVRSRPNRTAATHSRRDALRWGALSALAVPLAACGVGYDDSPDPLDALAKAARSDAEAARSLATAGSTGASQVGGVAIAVSRVRFEQADALAEEVRRANRPPSAGRVPDEKVADLPVLGKRLVAAREQARKLALSAPRHRAGLLGSVAAGCAAAQVLSTEMGEPAELEFATPKAGTELPEETVAALQQALVGEHAAVWVYGLVTAFLPEDFAKALDRAETEHRLRRDACQGVLTAAAATPNPAEPAYVPAKPVTDIRSAMAVVITAEADSAATWRGVLERADDTAVRGFALDALASSAIRQTRWRAESGETHPAIALPGVS